jgi:hypothetical protein
MSGSGARPIKMSPQACVVTFLTWRLATQPDADWTQLSTIHQAEMFLIKGLGGLDATAGGCFSSSY